MATNHKSPEALQKLSINHVIVATLIIAGLSAIPITWSRKPTTNPQSITIVPGNNIRPATSSVVREQSPPSSVGDPADPEADAQAEVKDRLNPVDEPTAYAAGGGRRRVPVDAGAMRIDPPRQLTASQATEDEVYLKRMAEDYRE